VKLRLVAGAGAESNGLTAGADGSGLSARGAFGGFHTVLYWCILGFICRRNAMAGDVNLA
jgi:hypothetical protein